MKQSRKEFLQSSAILISSAFIPALLKFIKSKPLLSFSTLGCPDWEFSAIVDFAAQHNYNGIEVRGIKRQLDLSLCNEFRNAEQIAQTMKMMDDKNLKFVDLGSSATMHFPEGDERKKNLDEGKRFIDLAHQLKCPFVRVFPNIIPKDQGRDAVMDLIIKGLLELADHAKGSDVTVVIESHGDLVHIDDLEKVMKSAAHEHVGMIWDVANMWTITKEPVSEVHTRLKRYIKHTHIKDAKLADGKINYVFLGQGDVPIFEAIDLLAKESYKGYYSFEWEKMWHPEIAASELAIAGYSKAMKEHWRSL